MTELFLQPRVELIKRCWSRNVLSKPHDNMVSTRYVDEPKSTDLLFTISSFFICLFFGLFITLLNSGERTGEG